MEARVRRKSSSEENRDQRPAYDNERYWTPKEIAALLRVSVDFAARLFENEPGVVILGRPVSDRRRRYRTLRVPDHVFQRVLTERSLFKVNQTPYTKRP